MCAPVLISGAVLYLDSVHVCTNRVLHSLPSALLTCCLLTLNQVQQMLPTVLRTLHLAHLNKHLPTSYYRIDTVLLYYLLYFGTRLRSCCSTASRKSSIASLFLQFASC